MGVGPHGLAGGGATASNQVMLIASSESTTLPTSTAPREPPNREP